MKILKIFYTKREPNTSVIKSVKKLSHELLNENTSHKLIQKDKIDSNTDNKYSAQIISSHNEFGRDLIKTVCGVEVNALSSSDYLKRKK